MSEYSIFTRAELITMLKESNQELLQSQAKESVKTDPINKEIISRLTQKVSEIRSAIANTQSISQAVSSSHQDYQFIQVAASLSTAMKDVKRLEPGVPGKNFIASLRNVCDLLVLLELRRNPRLEKNS